MSCNEIGSTKVSIGWVSSGSSARVVSVGCGTCEGDGGSSTADIALSYMLEAAEEIVDNVRDIGFSARECIGRDKIDCDIAI